MKWAAPWKSKRLEVAWRYATKGYLWRLLPSAGGQLVIEDRDIEQKEVFFTCLDQRTGRALWEKVQFKEKWWITIDTIHRDVVFLHEYASPDMPEQKKIFAVDIRSGGMLWTNEEMKLLVAHEDRVYACKDGLVERQFYELDLATGNVNKEIDEHSFGDVREAAAGHTGEYLRFPEVYRSNDEEESVRRAVNRATDTSANATFIEYFESGNNVVVGYYENTGTPSTQQSLRQRIAVVDSKTNKVMFRDSITEDAVMAVPETFFQMHSFVYYIKNKRTLTALNLSAG